MNPSSQWTVLAHLLRPQGRRGEMLAELLTDFPERFPGREHLVLAPPGFDGLPAEARAVEVVSHWLPAGRNAGRVVLALAGIESISAAEALVGLDLLTPNENRIELGEDARYVGELVGCRVVAGDEPLGTITSVYFSTTPDGLRKLEDVAPLLTVVTKGGDEILIPFVKAFVVSEDLPGKLIHMRLPEGLLELNR